MPTIHDLVDALKERLNSMDREIADTAKRDYEILELLKPLVQELIPQVVKRMNEHDERLGALEKRAGEQS